MKTPEIDAWSFLSNKSEAEVEKERRTSEPQTLSLSFSLRSSLLNHTLWNKKQSTLTKHPLKINSEHTEKPCVESESARRSLSLSWEILKWSVPQCSCWASDQISHLPTKHDKNVTNWMNELRSYREDSVTILWLHSQKCQRHLFHQFSLNFFFLINS